jgi:hypothetical protein
LIPSRGRPQRLTATIESINKTKVGEVEVLTYRDDDDPELDAYLLNHVPTILGPRINLPAAHNALEKLAKHYYCLLGSDDIIFKTHGWDEKMKAAMPADGIGAVFTADGWKNAANHCLYTKKLSEITGVYPLEFEHFGMDTYFTDCMQAVGRFIYVGDVVIEHHHFRNGKAEQDATYRHPREGLANQRDTALLKRFRKTRMPEHIQKLKDYINAFAADSDQGPTTPA